MTDLVQFRPFRAVFAPSRTDDLRAGAAEWVGKVLTWSPDWVLEDGPYAGQWACTTRYPGCPFVWAPESDLAPAAE